MRSPRTSPSSPTAIYCGPWSNQSPPKIAPAEGGVDHLYLSIDWEDLAKLERQREEALRLGVLVSGPDDLVPARLALDQQDRLMKAKVRLKGDWSEHVKGRHWSFRVKLAGEGRLFGMKTFSLQHPRHRGGIHGWLYHRVLRREEILALRYRFVRLHLNDTDFGVYAVEEHFDRRLIEDNGFREGPILRIDEGLHWQLVVDDQLSPPIRSLSELSDIRPYSSSAIDAPGPLRESFLRAASLLEGVRNGTVPLADAFDIAKTARYYALSDLTGAHHGIGWANQRFYFNPVTVRLEPIGFDADAGKPLTKTAMELGQGFAPLWRHESFQRAYLGELERLIGPNGRTPDYLDDLFAEIGPELARAQSTLTPDPSSRIAPQDVYRANVGVIRKALQPLRALRAHLASAPIGAQMAERSRIQLDVVSLSELPIEVVALTRGEDLTLSLPEPVTLSRWGPGSVQVDPVIFDVELSQRDRWHDLSGAALQYRIAGTQKLMTETLLSWPAPRAELVPPDLMQPVQAPEAQPFLETTDDGELRILPGEWVIDRDLVIPRGQRLKCGPGVVLDLVAGASLLSYSPLDFQGLPEEPIVIRSSDRTGQGLLVIDAETESRLEHVHFADLSAPRGRGWAMTGAVTFYQSPVVISGSSFVRNHASDDALNIFRSPLRITNTRFHDLPSDAIDVDFGTGEIRHCAFERILGDAVDVSGSQITLGQSTFDNIGDKAVSAGEHSYLRFVELDITRARFGVVSKDDSKVEGRGLELHDGDIGFAAFRKKSEFGSASIMAYKYQAEGLNSLYELETGSTLVLESENMPANAQNLRERLYPGGASE